MTDFGWVDRGLDTKGDPRESSNYETMRFFVKKGQKRAMVMLSGLQDFYHIRQHEVWIDNKPHFVTCVQNMFKDTPDCPLCLKAKAEDNKKIARTEFWVGTLLDLEGVERDGKKVGVGKRLLLPLKYGDKERLMTTFETCEENDLQFQFGKFIFARSDSDKASRVGDSITPIGGFDLKKWVENQKSNGNEVDITPFNILEMDEFKPNFAQALSVAKRLPGGFGSTEPEDSAEVDEEIPF